MKLLLSITILLICVLSVFAQSEYPEKYNVVWNSPSTDASGQMPLGNGDIAAGVYAIENDAFTSANKLLSREKKWMVSW